VKHKVSELEGALLDAAVAKALNYQVPAAWPYPTLWTDARPSSNWAHGGPIIEWKRISVMRFRSAWYAEVLGPDGGAGYIDMRDGDWLSPSYTECRGSAGPTALNAAMRAFVASELGEEIELSPPALPQNPG
jgi:hypothetical protein